MSYLDVTWQQQALDAMRATFDVDAHTKRDMVQFLLDEGFWDKERLTFESAEARFRACLNPHKAEFFKLSEAWALMKRFGRYQLVLAQLEDFGFDTPRQLPTEMRRQELLDRIARAVEGFNNEVARARAELARLAAGDPQQRLHPSIAQGGAVKFSMSLDHEDPAEPRPPNPGSF